MNPRLRSITILSIIFQPNCVLSKGGGGGSSSSGGRGGYYRHDFNTRWVFWYYSPYGTRSCGNLCILTVAIFALIILTVIGCLLYQCIWSRKREKKEKLQSTDDSSSQLTDPESGVPPSYGNQLPASEFIAWHGQKHEASASSYKAGEKFTHDYSPQEKLPDVSDIINKGGAPAYRFELDPQAGTRQQATLSNDGRVIQFQGEEDTMVQANFPLLFTADAEKILR